MPNRNDFWEKLKAVSTGFLVVNDSYMPFTHYGEQDSDSIYFITAANTTAALAATSDASSTYVVISDTMGFYSKIDGTLSVEHSRETLKKIWNVFAAAWFDGDIDDPDIRLLKMTPVSAEVWTTTKNPFMFLYEIARGNLTEHQPDPGKYEVIKFD